MRKIRFLLFALLALLYVTNVNAITKGDKFTRDGITYEVTLMRPAGNGHTELNEVQVISSTISGTLSIPQEVKDLNNQYTFKVTAIGSAGTYTNVTAVNLPSTLKTIKTNAFSTRRLQPSTFLREPMISMMVHLLRLMVLQQLLLMLVILSIQQQMESSMRIMAVISI